MPLPLHRRTARIPPPLTASRSSPAAYGAILWDNDGVLVDTERWYFQATREILADLGIDLTPPLYFEHFLASDNGTARLLAEHGLAESEIEALRQTRNGRCQRLLEQESLMIAGVRETLQALRPHFVMGIVTSSRRSHFETIHRRTGLLEFFDFALTQGDYLHSKPAPDPYLAAIARSGLPASRCLVIEDAPRGLAAARAADLDCWVIPTEFTRAANFSAAARILDQVPDIVPLLLAGRS
jgi:HAD superfamily hydrolase (TIGR01509 family)